jgi:DegV family protein with EDD domain
MNSRIVSDSCADFNECAFGEADGLERVPFRIIVDDEELVDRQLDIGTLLARMRESRNRIMTACPSPDGFLRAFQKCTTTFVVTISSRLSGSYNSATVARGMLAETHPHHCVHIFDSRTATAGQNLVVLKLKQLLAENLTAQQVIEKTNDYIAHIKTFGALGSLDNLAKNGRISNIKALIGTLLHVIPIISDNGNGEIVLRGAVRGTGKALVRLSEMVGEGCVDVRNTVLSITHVNAREKAERLKEMIVSRYPFKDVFIFEASGLSTVYTGEGGVTVAY